MLKIEQIKELESKIIKTIDLIKSLREEKQGLEQVLKTTQKKMAEMETVIENLKSDQTEIEDGIARALNSLDRIEDELADKPNDSQPNDLHQVAKGSKAGKDAGETDTIELIEDNEEAPAEKPEGKREDTQDNELEIF